jgi:hypothetical protein
MKLCMHCSCPLYEFIEDFTVLRRNFLYFVRGSLDMFRLLENPDHHKGEKQFSLLRDTAGLYDPTPLEGELENCTEFLCLT